MTFTSISAVPLYAGLWRFSEGRDFAQWTGDDSKALMKVLLSLFRLNMIMTRFSTRFMLLQLPDGGRVDSGHVFKYCGQSLSWKSLLRCAADSYERACLVAAQPLILRPIKCQENRNWNICRDMIKSAHISPSPFRGADMAQ